MKTLFVSVVIVVIGFSFLQFREPKESSSQPQEFNIAEACGGPCNVIVVMSTALNAKHMSTYGYNLETTPFTDEFFSEHSLRYNFAHSPSNWLLPSVASMMRGKYPSEIKNSELAHNEGTLINSLTENGVTVGGVIMGEDVGWRTLALESIGSLFSEDQMVAKISSEEHEQKFLKANSWLEKQSEEDEQFFLFVHDTTPHEPYDAGEPYDEMFGLVEKVQPKHDHFREGLQHFYSEKELEQVRIQYNQDIRRFDDLFKNFVENIPQSVIDTSIIILISDHGAAFGEHGMYWYMKSLYDEFTHIPFLVRVPDIETQEINRPISLVSFTPTILDWMGIPFDSNEFSEASLVSGASTYVRTEHGISPLVTKLGTHSFSNFPNRELVSKEDREKFIMSPLRTVSLRDDNYKVMITDLSNQTQEYFKTEVYAYKTDPNETKNLATTTEAMTPELIKLIDATKQLLE